jgi:proteasome accessory factor B
VRSRVAAFALRPEGDLGTATIRVRKGTCFPLRRSASAIEEGDDGWDVLVLTYRDGFEGYVAEFGADVIVVEPQRLRETVIRNLRALAQAEPTEETVEKDLAELRAEWEAAS